MPGIADEVLSGMCVGVPEADVIEVWVGSATEVVRVRLAGVDRDSLLRAYGSYALVQTKELVYGKPVEVMVQERGADGVVLGRVFVDQRDLASIIVSQGLARRDTSSTSGTRLEPAEESARSERRGLWAHTPPTPSPTPARSRSDLSLSDIAWQVDRKRAKAPWPTPTPGVGQGATIEMTLDSWVGSSESDLITNWGVPTRVTSDGRDGRILVYERRLDPQQTDADLDTRPWRSLGRYDRQLKAWVYSEQFFIDASGRIYDHRWDTPQAGQ